MIAGSIELQLFANVARLQRDMDQARQTVTRATDGMARAANAAKAALASIGAGIGLSQIIQMSDQYAKFTAQLRLATTSTREYGAAYADVKRISTSAQQDLQATGMLYARIANGTRELGTSQKQVAAITETVNMALKVSGATTAEAASAQLQLSQAFASGTLRGEEFNAVNEAAPRLMKALADGMGVPVGALKAMATEGKITSAIMAEVLPRALEDLRREAKEVQTISGAFTVLKNNVMEFVGVQANASGGVAMLTGAIGLLASNLGLLAGAMLTVMAAKLGIWLSGMAMEAYKAAAANQALAASNLATAKTHAAATATTMALTAARVSELRAAVLAAEGQVALAITTNGLIPAQARAAVAAQAHASALVAQTAAMRAASVAGGILRGALAFLGGPIGAIITLLGLAATAWMVWGDKAKDANAKASQSVDETTTEMIARLDKQIEKLRERNALMNAEPRLTNAGDMSDAEKDTVAAARKALDSARAGTGEYAGQSSSMRQLAEIDLLANYEKALARVATRRDEMTAADSRGRDQKMAEWYAQNGTQAQKMAAELEKLKKELGSIPPEMEKLVRAKYADKGAATVIKQEATAYQNLVTSIGEKIAANRLELAGYDKLSETQKMTIKLDEAVASGKNKLTPKHIAETRALIAMAAAQEDAIAAKDRWSKIDEQVAKNDSDYQARLRAGTKALDDQIETMTRQIDTYGMTESAVHRLSLAKLEADLATKPLDIAALIALDAQIERTKTLISLAGKKEILDDNKKTTDQIAADYKRLSENIESSLTDSLMRGFESGKSFGRNLIDTLKNMFKTLVLQPTIQGILAPIAGGAASMMPGAAQAAGGGGTDIFGVASAAKTAYSAISGGFAGIATTVAETVQATMYATGMTTQIASNGALATGAGAAAGYLGGAAVGVYGGRALSNGYGISGSGNGLVNAGTAIGAIVGGPIGAAIGGLIAGAANRLFGMKAKEITGTTLNGSFGAQGFSGSTEEAWLRKGGVFRSDKTGVDKTAIDAATAKQFTVGYDALKAASADFAQVLGINADSIKTRAQSMSIAITSDEEANKKAISEFFIGVGDSIATELLPTLSDFAEEGEGASATLQRLATNYATIDAALTAIGLTFGAVGVESLAARERLVELSGGIEALAQNAAGFAQNFLTEAERVAPVAAAVTKAMTELGFASVDTRDEFKSLVQGLDLTTESGATNYAALMKLQGAFAQVYPAIESTSDALESAADAIQAMKDAASALMGNVDGAMGVLQRVVDAEKTRLSKAHEVTMKALQERIDTETAGIAKHNALSDAIATTLGQMSISGNDSGSRVAAQAEISAALAMARAGAMPEADSLKGTLSVLSKDSTDMFATMQDYQRDFYRTQNELAELGKLSDVALSVEEKTLAALIAQKDATQVAFDAEIVRLDAILEREQAQIDELKGLSTIGLSVAQAVESVRLAILAAQGNSFSGSASSINNAYKSVLGRAPDAAGMEFFQGQAASGTSIGAIVDAIENSPEAKAQGLFQSVLGRTGDASGIAFWTKALAGGMSEQAAREMMMHSDEFKKMPRFEVGANYIPNDMMAILDEGERVIPAADNRELMARLRNPSESNGVLAAAVERLSATVDRQTAIINQQQDALNRTANASKRLADGMEVVTDGFNAMRTKEEEPV